MNLIAFLGSTRSDDRAAFIKTVCLNPQENPDPGLNVTALKSFPG